MASQGSRLSEVVLPDGCALDSGEYQFSSNIDLKKVTLPCAMNIIPKDCFSNCIALEEVKMPASLVSIESGAFYMCNSLRAIEFPADLSAVSSNAFSGCASLEQLYLPSKVEELGYDSFSGLTGVKAIYSASVIPPVCVEKNGDADLTPFSNTPSDIPVYVPVGSGDAYREAFGWSRFTNIIETADFPQVGIEGIMEDTLADGVIYDLSGYPVTDICRGLIYIKDGKRFILTK